ncbi:hypothetical protein BKA93DRAFT_758920 [Sparassis latifolia]
MFNYLTNLPNRVPQTQKFVQSSHEPIYYRLPRSKIYVRTYYTGFAVAMAMTAYGAFSLIRGKPASE